MAEIDSTDNANDIEKVQGFIKEQVETYFNELSSKQPVQQQVATARTEQDIAKQQLQDLISPFINPGLNEARLTSADAQDYVKFYTNNTDAAEYQDQVEAMFTKLKDSGKPMPRANILDYLRGNEFRTDPDKFTEKQLAKRKAATDRAELATDFGAGALGRAKNDSNFSNFESKSLEDMEKALDGVTF